MNFNLNSNPQMQEFLYEFLNLKPLADRNKKGNLSCDEATITQYAEKYNIEFCNLLLNYRKLAKAQGTYIADLRRNTFEDGMVHHELWLNVAETFRSSSSDPNLQNQPKHGDILPGLPWKTIRKVFVRLNKDYLLGEVDYDGAEVKVSGMLGDDPQLIEDLNNDMDMHSHWAIRLFGLKGYSYDQVKEKFGENERFLAKNNFTFATLFGAQYTSVATEMRKSDFYSKYVHTHYNQRKIKSEDFNSYYLTFSENHIKECQNDFWKRYKIHKLWQKSLIDFYYKHGYVENPFGFRRRYPLSPNEIINFPIQSTSFLLLLDSLIKVEEELVNNNWKSHQINQIHDSGKAYIYKPEICDYVDMVNDKMVNKPELAWTHKVAMLTDWEFGHNWLEMKRVKELAGKTSSHNQLNKRKE